MNNFLEKQAFHLVGIKGVAMTALAQILLDMGKTVTGSDVKETFQTDQILNSRKIKVSQFNKNNINSKQVVIYSAGHSGRDNSEVVEAFKQKKIVLCLPEVIGYLTTLKQNIAICGSHGKTTTSALISFVLSKLKTNVSYFVGTSSFMNQGSGKWDKGRFFVTEADEYLADNSNFRISKFLFFSPFYIICTNLDFDHSDFFKDFSAVKQAFSAFFNKLPNKGKLIVNGDDKVLLSLAKKSKKPYLSYGFKQTNDYVIKSDNLSFTVFYDKQKLATVKPRILGKHNMLNIASGIILFHLLNLDLGLAVAAIEDFAGAKRRIELRAKVGNSLIIDDYAHHPSEIKASISAIRSRYPNYKIALCFQPHTYSRTKSLLSDFVSSLSMVDYLGLLPIFASAREKADKNVNSELILAKIKSSLWSQLIKTNLDWQKMIKQTQAISSNWVYIAMGAGDIYKKIDLIITYLNEYHAQRA